MIGSEPPRLSRNEPKLGEVALALTRLSLPKRHPFGVTLDANRSRFERARSSGSQGSRRTVSPSSWPPSRARIHAPPRRRSRSSAPPWGKQRRDNVAARGCTSSLKSASVAARSPRSRSPKDAAYAHPDFGPPGVASIGPRARARERAHHCFKVKARGPDAAAKSLSGGNLQKFIVGRELDAVPRMLIVSQPTWGVDVGAAAEIRGQLLRLRDAGCALLVVSEELDELFELSDRLVVIARGCVSPSIPTSEATVEQIGEWMSGLWPGSPLVAPLREAAHA